MTYYFSFYEKIDKPYFDDSWTFPTMQVRMTPCCFTVDGNTRYGFIPNNAVYKHMSLLYSIFGNRGMSEFWEFDFASRQFYLKDNDAAILMKLQEDSIDYEQLISAAQKKF